MCAWLGGTGHNYPYYLPPPICSHDWVGGKYYPFYPQICNHVCMTDWLTGWVVHSIGYTIILTSLIRDLFHLLTANILSLTSSPGSGDIIMSGTLAFGITKKMVKLLLYQVYSTFTAISPGKVCVQGNRGCIKVVHQSEAWLMNNSPSINLYT